MTDDPSYPDVDQKLVERAELFRIAAQRVVDAHREGRKTDPEALKWALGIVQRNKPLGRPLSTGDVTR